jgi:lipoprotein-anchoring transpeptidase ErfK/SrfK
MVNCIPVLLTLFLAVSILIGNSNTLHAATDARETPHKTIVVNLSKQWLYAYENGKQILDTPVTTGRPELPTPVGTFSVFSKLSPMTFRSPWPEGSPHWYPPSPANYAMEWAAGGYFLHDAPWRSVFGPGTNNWHDDPQFGPDTGSHGCISMSTSAAARLYAWTPIGTTVEVIA